MRIGGQKGSWWCIWDVTTVFGEQTFWVGVEHSHFSCCPTSTIKYRVFLTSALSFLLVNEPSLPTNTSATETELSFNNPELVKVNGDWGKKKNQQRLKKSDGKVSVRGWKARLLVPRLLSVARKPGRLTWTTVSPRKRTSSIGKTASPLTRSRGTAKDSLGFR